MPEAYPGIVANFRQDVWQSAKALKADIFLANHENFFDLHEKRARQLAGDANAFVDPGELGRFTATMTEAYAKTLAEQQAAH
jgi:metallo-beta-lactamase class B